LQKSLSAFEELYRTHGGRMKSIAYNILGNVPDAEDAVQEAFLKVHRSFQDFRGDASLSTWLYRILVNACHDIGRQRKRRREDPGVDVEAADEPVSPATDHPLRVTLEKAVSRLAPRHRDVFLLFEVEGFKHREIAEILDIAEGTSKATLFEAKRELQLFIRQERRRPKAAL